MKTIISLTILTVSILLADQVSAQEKVYKSEIAIMPLSPFADEKTYVNYSDGSPLMERKVKFHPSALQYRHFLNSRWAARLNYRLTSAYFNGTSERPRNGRLYEEEYSYDILGHQFNLGLQYGITKNKMSLYAGIDLIYFYEKEKNQYFTSILPDPAPAPGPGFYKITEDVTRKTNMYGAGLVLGGTYLITKRIGVLLEATMDFRVGESTKNLTLTTVSINNDGIVTGVTYTTANEKGILKERNLFNPGQSRLMLFYRF